MPANQSEILVNRLCSLGITVLFGGKKTKPKKKRKKSTSKSNQNVYAYKQDFIPLYSIIDMQPPFMLSADSIWCIFPPVLIFSCHRNFLISCQLMSLFSTINCIKGCWFWCSRCWKKALYKGKTHISVYSVFYSLISINI